MVGMFFKYISKLGKEYLKVESVCLFGGLDDEGNYLTDLRRETTSYCQPVPHQLQFKEKYVDAETFLSFLRKIVYINLNMNKSGIVFRNELPDEDTGSITVIAESIGDIRRVTLAVYAESMRTHIFVLDPMQGRPNLMFKSSDEPTTDLDMRMLAKNIDIPTVRFPLPPAISPFPNIHTYAYTTFNHVLHRLRPSYDTFYKNSVSNAESRVTDGEFEANKQY